METFSFVDFFPNQTDHFKAENGFRFPGTRTDTFSSNQQHHEAGQWNTISHRKVFPLRSFDWKSVFAEEHRETSCSPFCLTIDSVEEDRK